MRDIKFDALVTGCLTAIFGTFSLYTAITEGIWLLYPYGAALLIVSAVAWLAWHGEREWEKDRGYR